MQHPMHENLRARLMIGLHRSGWRSLAFAVSRLRRRALVGELRIEPSPHLARTYEGLLVSDHSADAPWAAGHLPVERTG